MLLSQPTELNQKNRIVACFQNVWKDGVGSLDYLSSAASALQSPISNTGNVILCSLIINKLTGFGRRLLPEWQVAMRRAN